jgi:hypothetical protein
VRVAGDDGEVDGIGADEDGGIVLVAGDDDEVDADEDAGIAGGLRVRRRERREDNPASHLPR